MKNLLVRAVTVILAVSWQFGLAMLIQLLTNGQPIFLVIWFTLLLKAS